MRPLILQRLCLGASWRKNKGGLGPKHFLPVAWMRARFEDADILAFGGQQLHAQYTRFKLNLVVDRDPNLRWCPKVGCNNYVRKTGLLAKTATCACG